MSIDARVQAVIVNEDGSGKLVLIDRPRKVHENSGGIAGQKSLSFTVAPHEVTALNGLDIWGGANSIMLGEREIAQRIGYGGIAFHVDGRFVEAVREYHDRHYANQAPES